MIWAATGTRYGATSFQLASVGWVWSRYGITELHDGDAIGVDEQLYYLGRAFGAKIVMHPPRSSKFRAWCGDNKDEFRRPKGYFERDKDMVNESGTLVGCPKHTFEEFEHSGTWNTIRYARTLGRPIAIIWPGGRIAYENWTLTRLTYGD